MEEKDNLTHYYFVAGCVHNYLESVKNLHKSFEIPTYFDGVKLVDKKIQINFPEPNFDKTRELVDKTEQEYNKLKEAVKNFNEANT